MKQIYLKAIAMVCMVMGSLGMWAQDEYTEIYKRALADWTADDLTDWNAGSGVTADATNGIGAAANSTATYVTKTFAVGDNSKIKYEVDWTFQAATGRDVNWNWIQFGSFLRVAINSTYNLQVSTDAGTSWKGTLESSFANSTFTRHIEVVFDVQTKMLESFKYNGQDKTDLVAGTYNNATFNTVSTGFIRNGSVNWTLNNYIQAITVSEAEKSAAAEATYAINYTFEGNTVYSEEGTSVEGATIEAKTVIVVDDVKYLCEAVTAPSLVLASGSNTLNVPVRKPYTATLNVTTDLAGESSVEAIALTETDDKVCAWTYVYPYYTEKDGVWYVADETASFGETGTFTDGQTIEKTVAYSKADESVVYYVEPGQETPGTNIQYSNGNTGTIPAGGYTSSGVVTHKLPAGVYKFTVNIITNVNNRNILISDCADGTLKPFVEFTGTGLKEETITLTSPTVVSISGRDADGKFNLSAEVDYILVQKVGDVTATATIGATGYTTFASASALDLDEMTEGVVAYYAASADDNAVILKPATGVVAANTGLILAGEADTEVEIAVADAEGEAIEGNLLVGCAEGATEVQGPNLYVLVNNEGTAEFQSLADHAATIPAGKAYLELENEGKSRLSISFGEGDATAIEAVEKANAVDGIIYNIAGQRVQNPVKGIYIVNGKKVLVK